MSEIHSERASEFLEKLNQLCKDFEADARETEDDGSSLLVSGRIDGYPFVLAVGDAFSLAASSQLGLFASQNALKTVNGGPSRLDDEPKKKGGWGKLL